MATRWIAFFGLLLFFTTACATHEAAGWDQQVKLPAQSQHPQVLPMATQWAYEAATATAEASRRAAQPTATVTSTPVVSVYIVQDGDSLGLIAQRLHVAVDDIVLWNNISNPDLIEIGQVLQIIHAP